ncbi:hypothetical protein OHS18_35290 [Amycolatopsis sp. NBC_00355]|uniref:hypothetical protein n=1 Tax=Amycolatopsis sp. NBC_00355 TaxID=2975957 RepID=UPI002E263D7E
MRAGRRLGGSGRGIARRVVVVVVTSGVIAGDDQRHRRAAGVGPEKCVPTCA